MGEKIRSEKKKYLKDEKGDFRRELAVDRITSLSNTIIIVDEAHNLTNNDEGKALEKIIKNKNSKNLKVILMTATPMKNLATDIISLMNFLKPNDPLVENKIFDINKLNNSDINIKKDGIDYLKKKLEDM